MKNNYLNSSTRIVVLLFCFSLLIPFQNCAVYKSDGRKVFESSIQDSETKGCYPYIDTNLAMQFIGTVDGSLNVYKTFPSGENGMICDFYTENHLLKHINCKVSQGNAEMALLLKQDGISAFEGTQSVWSAPAALGFVGTVHDGYVTLDDDALYTIRFLALDGDELKGVGCSVRLTPAEYNGAIASIQSTLSKMAFEMAINNQD